MHQKMEEAMLIMRADLQRLHQDMGGLQGARDDAEKEAARVANELVAVSQW